MLHDPGQKVRQGTDGRREQDQIGCSHRLDQVGRVPVDQPPGQGGFKIFYTAAAADDRTHGAAHFQRPSQRTPNQSDSNHRQGIQNLALLRHGSGSGDG